MMFDDVPYSRRGNMSELLCSRDDDRLYVRSEAPVGVGYRPLVLEIEHIAYASHYMLDAEFAALVDRKGVVFDYFNTFESLSYLTDYVNPLVHRKESPLVLVDTDRHDYLVEHREGTLEDIEVTCGEGIEGSRKQCLSFHVFIIAN